MRLALLLLAGCATTAYSRTPRPCQAQAVAIVWQQTMGRSDPPPDIWWVPASALNCQLPGREKGYATTAGCIGSDAWASGADLVWYGNWQRTNLAHELAHVAQARDGLPPDLAHVTAPFQPGGTVALANARLAGLSCKP